jgi:hypothetical protein
MALKLVRAGAIPNADLKHNQSLVSTLILRLRRIARANAAQSARMAIGSHNHIGRAPSTQ